MSDKNNNFQDLKRLLKLKQHEIPPPGYFNHFSGDIIARIRTGETGGGGSFLEQIQSDSPFASAFLQLFASRPGIVGAFATSLCLLLLVGVLFADRSDTGMATSEPGLFAQSDSSGNEASPTLVASADTLAPPDSGITISTNPVSSLQPVNSLFGAPQNPLFQQVSLPVSQ
jgi:hypothetical protein